MCNDKKYITMKVKPKTKQELKILAAQYGMHMKDILQMLIESEIKHKHIWKQLRENKISCV